MCARSVRPSTKDKSSFWNQHLLVSENMLVQHVAQMQPNPSSIPKPLADSWWMLKLKDLMLTFWCFGNMSNNCLVDDRPFPKSHFCASPNKVFVLLISNGAAGPPSVTRSIFPHQVENFMCCCNPNHKRGSETQHTLTVELNGSVHKLAAAVTHMPKSH